MTRASKTRLVGRIERAPGGAGYTVTVVRETELARVWVAGTESRHDAVVDRLATLMGERGADAPAVNLAARGSLRSTRGLRAEVVALGLAGRKTRPVPKVAP